MQVRTRLQVRKWKYMWSPLGVMPRGGSNDIVFVSVVNEISPKTDQSASLLKELANQKRGIVIWRPGGGSHCMEVAAPKRINFFGETKRISENTRKQPIIALG